MGIKGFSAFAKKHNLFSQCLKAVEFKKDYKDFEILVDLYGSFYNLCVNYATKNDFRELAYCMKSLFEGLNVTFFIDGARSLEKHETHVIRDAKSKSKLSSLSNLASHLDPNKKLKKSKWKQINILSKSCFRFTRTHAETIKNMFESVSLKVIIADFEADVAIAKHVSTMDENKKTHLMVISNDSDLLIHDIPLLARPRFSNKFDIHSMYLQMEMRSNVLKRLKLTSNGMIALGILSGNDYCQNLRGYRINKVHEFIISIDADKTKDVIFIVNEFEQCTGKVGHFCSAKEIFLAHSEHQCMQCLTDSNQTEYEESLSLIKDYYKKHNDLKDEKKATFTIRSKQELKHLLLEGQRNRFSPLVNSTYGRYKPKVLDTTKLSSTVEAEADVKDLEQTKPLRNTSKTQSTRKANPKKPRKGKKKKAPRRKKSNMATRSIMSDKPRKKAEHTQATKDMQSLKKQYETKTWKLGTLKACLKRSSLPEEFKSTLLDRIQGVVALINWATYAAVIITELYYKQSTASKDTDNEFLIEVGGGSQYWGNLIAYLIDPTKLGKKGPRLYQKVRNFMDSHELKFTIAEAESKYVEFIYCKLLHYHGTSVDRIMALHFIGSSTVLAAKVKEICPETAQEVDKLMEMVDQTILNKGKKN